MLPVREKVVETVVNARPAISWTAWISLVLALISMLAAGTFSYGSQSQQILQTAKIVEQQATEQKELREELVRVRIALAELKQSIDNTRPWIPTTLGVRK